MFPFPSIKSMLVDAVRDKEREIGRSKCFDIEYLLSLSLQIHSHTVLSKFLDLVRMRADAHRTHTHSLSLSN